ncbi:MAG TPA: type I glutamate--ammonia ligase [Verrucomicrobiota bacterium]|nr:type I glutamate--ammonia ligase [Verrucomicrobiota bacterium]HNT14561.1 type I glutamate--ammonia ligase [Verrucomicrobiota bacterium]
MTSQEVLTLCKNKNVQLVDVKFCDFLGTWQHFCVPIAELNAEVFAEGLGFDGSSIRGWKSIEASDMLLLLDPDTAIIDPFPTTPTLSLVADGVDPMTREPYSRDPRNVARKAEAYLKSTGVADTAYMGPEAEFFIFDEVRYGQTANSGFYFLDSIEGIWNSGREEGPNLGNKIRHKEGYFPVAPADTQVEIRNEMINVMRDCGLRVEREHHEVATAGQAEIDLRFNSLVKMADDMMLYKYIVKNVARRRNKTVTFMPKPLFGDNGSGMHTHQSLWKKGKPLFAGNQYAGLSEMALHYIGGILKHARAMAAFTNPTVNSYKRLTPGFEAPVNLAYSSRNRSAAIRIPTYSPSPKAKRIEYRPPDPTANPYLAMAAMLMAGLDGIQNRIDPGEPLDKNIYELPPEELKQVPSMPGSLTEACDALEKDHGFLLKGDVFTRDVIETWIEMKRKEQDQIRLRPHPWEFSMYYDA